MSRARVSRFRQFHRMYGGHYRAMLTFIMIFQFCSCFALKPCWLGMGSGLGYYAPERVFVDWVTQHHDWLKVQIIYYAQYIQGLTHCTICYNFNHYCRISLSFYSLNCFSFSCQITTSVCFHPF